MKTPVYIIGEIGSNWGGNLDAAFALIDAVADSGANAAKFQAGHADHVYDPALYPDEHAAFRRWIEPTLDWLPLLAGRCAERGIDFGCSAFCIDALEAVDPFVKWHKVASIEHRWLDYLVSVMAKEKPVLVSLGLEDGNGLDVLASALNRLELTTPQLVFLHCTVAYPAPLEESDLHRVTSLRLWANRGDPTHERYSVGLSDHTVHPTIAPCAAVALGARFIEKHIKLPDHQAHGDYGFPPEDKGPRPFRPAKLNLPKMPDEDHAINPLEFKTMVEAVRLTEKALGDSRPRVRPSEESYLRYRRGPRGLRGS